MHCQSPLVRVPAPVVVVVVVCAVRGRCSRARMSDRRPSRRQQRWQHKPAAAAAQGRQRGRALFLQLAQLLPPPHRRAQPAAARRGRAAAARASPSLIPFGLGTPPFLLALSRQAEILNKGHYAEAHQLPRPLVSVSLVLSHAPGAHSSDVGEIHTYSPSCRPDQVVRF